MDAETETFLKIVAGVICISLVHVYISETGGYQKARRAIRSLFLRPVQLFALAVMFTISVAGFTIEPGLSIWLFFFTLFLWCAIFYPD